MNESVSEFLFDEARDKVLESDMNTTRKENIEHRTLNVQRRSAEFPVRRSMLDVRCSAFGFSDRGGREEAANDCGGRLKGAAA